MKCVGVPEPQCWGNDVTVNSGLWKHLLSSYSRVWKRASGERPSCDLVLMKRGESFNFTHPGQVRKRRSGPGQARDLEASTDSEHRPRGTMQRLACLWFLSADCAFCAHLHLRRQRVKCCRVNFSQGWAAHTWVAP